MSFPLSLRSWPTKPKESASLELSIKRIHEERGHFRNVTEQSLHEEIETHDCGASEQEAPNEVESTQDVEARRKELYAARTEMLKHVGQAQNEALTVLDFISLLISKDAPKQADLSMSPFLKENIPPGTLAFDRVPSSKPSKLDEERAKDVVTGWNLQSLNSAAEKLLNSATRLGKEMEKEARYWEQILSISEKGWSICKIPREGHTIGVRFGFSEAAPSFSARGLAALRPDSDGNIILDQGLSNQAKSIRVRLARQGRIVGSSTLPFLLSDSHANLEKLIHQARDSLFEEELYQEMIREARTLMSYNVQMTGNEIRFAARPQNLNNNDSASEPPLEVTIDQVSITDKQEGSIENRMSQLAEGFAAALRILLTHAYRHKFLARSQTPAPLSNDKRPTPIQEILRPLVTHFWHSEAVNTLHSFLSGMVETLHSAQLNADFTMVQIERETRAQQMTSAANIQSLLASLTTYLATTIKLNLPGEISHTITVSTQLAAPELGTQFRLDSMSSNESLEGRLVTEFQHFEELREQIIISVRDGIAAHITQVNPAWMMEKRGCEIRKKGASRMQLLKIGLQNEGLFLLRESTGKAPVVLAAWQGSDTDTQQQQGLAETMEKLNDF